VADKKISQLTGATTPLAGTEVLPIVQSGSTVKVSSDDLTVKNVRSNATTGILQVAGPGAGATRTMTVPDANFTAARSDAGQTFSGQQTFGGGVNVTGGKVQSVYGAGGDFVAVFQNTTSATPYGIWIKDAATPTAGYPLLNISSSDGATNYVRVDSDNGNVSVNKGNLVVGTAGKGIDFSAVADGPGTVITEVLPSYVAGYYNTTMAASTSGTITLGYKTLAYVKVGRMVTVTGEMSIDSVASPVGDISFVLPFTAGPSTGGRMGNSDFVVRAYSFAGGLTGTIYGTIVQNSTTCNLIKIENFVSAGIAANLQAGTTFIFCFSYIAAS
tara:strand:+ start:1367 stop:2353 length:987 start_codon:yes stop_codon:yes gene_type:complete